MNRTGTRILWAIAGALLVAAGIYCIANPDAGISTLSIILGIFVLVSGISDIAVFAGGHRIMYGTGWFLISGILTVVLALFMLFNNAFTALSLPFIFGMWLMVSGITEAVNSFDLRKMHVRGWGWFTVKGIILAIAGFLSFSDPVSSLMTINLLLGTFLIARGVSKIISAILAGRLFTV